MVHPQLPMETEKKKRILILSFSNKTLERLFLEQNRLDGSYTVADGNLEKKTTGILGFSNISFERLFLEQNH